MTALSQELVSAVHVKNISPMVGPSVDSYWDMIWNLFREIPGYTNLYSEAWTYGKVKMGHLQVWAYSDPEIRGILVTRINVFPKCKVLDLVGMSGIAGIDFMQDFDTLCENLAQQNGCAYIASTARPGMERLLNRRHGMARLSTTLVRPVLAQRSS